MQFPDQGHREGQGQEIRRDVQSRQHDGRWSELDASLRDLKVPESMHRSALEDDDEDPRDGVGRD